jgi:ketosteroid isomerase-like protein
MSQENVEIVKNAYRGLHERGVDGLLEFIHEDVEYLPVEESGAVHGHDALRRYFVRWMEPWEEFHIRPTEFRESGEDVFAAFAMNGRGRGSGVEVANEGFQVWHFRDGRGAHIEEYVDRAEALKAAGLSE